VEEDHGREGEDGRQVVWVMTASTGEARARGLCRAWPGFHLPKTACAERTKRSKID